VIPFTSQRSGLLARAHVHMAPCLIEFDLLRPDADDPDWLLPVAPAIVLAQRLNALEYEIAERRRQSLHLSETFAPFMALSAQAATPSDSITVLEGGQRINAALNLATAECQTEMLTVQ